MGNCIGEKNKRIFYIYILFQLAQCLWILINIIRGLSSQQTILWWLIYNLPLLVVLPIAAYFSLFATVLVSFHTFLCLTNLTTCILRDLTHPTRGGAFVGEDHVYDSLATRVRVAVRPGGAEERSVVLLRRRLRVREIRGVERAETPSSAWSASGLLRASPDHMEVGLRAVS